MSEQARPRVKVDPHKRPDEPGAVTVEHPEPPPRPLRQSEILRAFLERMKAAGQGEHSTVKLTRNAKGDTQIEVSVRTGESDEVATVDDAAAKAKSVYDTLAAFYPLAPPSADR